MDKIINTKQPDKSTSPLASGESSGGERLLFSPIDMSSLHSLSPGCGPSSHPIPAPPPPSPNTTTSTNVSTNPSPSKNTGPTTINPNPITSSAMRAMRDQGVENNQILRVGNSSNDLHDKSPIRKFFIPPTLEKKHSSGDLHSRLKTRKILGIGETDDNGDVHRSKISQLLGHNEHLYLQLPFGYWTWQTFLSGFMTIQAILLILFPTFSVHCGLVGFLPPSTGQVITEVHHPSTFTSDESQMNVINEMTSSPPAATTTLLLVISSGQYYGAALLVFSFLLWKFLYVNDKMIIRSLLFVTLVHYSMILAIDCITLIQVGFGSLMQQMILLLFLIRFGICSICYMYLSRLGLPSAGLRRSPSNKDQQQAQNEQTSSSSGIKSNNDETTTTNRASKDK